MIGNVQWQACGSFLLLCLFLFMSFVTDDVVRHWWAYRNYSGGLIMYFRVLIPGLIQADQDSNASTVPINRAGSVRESTILVSFLCVWVYLVC